MICLFDIAHKLFTFSEFIAASMVVKGLVAAIEQEMKAMTMKSVFDDIVQRLNYCIDEMVIPSRSVCRKF